MNSLITRYGVIGVSAEVSFACHFASHASRFAAISSAGRAVQQASAEPILHRLDQRRQRQLRIAEQRHLGRVALVQIARVVGGVDDRARRSAAAAWSADGGSARCRSPRIRSAREYRKCAPCPVKPLPPEPSASAWSSGNALLPSTVVITGLCSSSASRTSSSLASAYSTPWPARITGHDASTSRRAASSTSCASGAARVGRTGLWSSVVAADIELQQIARQLHHHRPRPAVLQLH